MPLDRVSCLVVPMWRSCSQLPGSKFNFSPSSRRDAVEIFLIHSSVVPLIARSFRKHSYMGRLGGPDPEMPLMDETIYHVLWDPTHERMSMVSRGFSSTHRLMTDAKIFDPRENELVKLPFFHGDVITDDTFIVIVEECC